MLQLTAGERQSDTIAGLGPSERVYRAVDIAEQQPA